LYIGHDNFQFSCRPHNFETKRSRGGVAFDSVDFLNELLL
jgi:hypothetical protein